jgi:hypothetical protein
MTFDVGGPWTRQSVSLAGGPFFEAQWVYWLQVGTTYADMRVPFVDSAPTSCFAGHSDWDGDRFRWTHELDLAPSPVTDADIGDLFWDGDYLVERGLLGQLGYEERWIRLPDGEGQSEAVMGPGSCRVQVGGHAITIIDTRTTGGSFNAWYQRRTPGGWQVHAVIGDVAEAP